MATRAVPSTSRDDLDRFCLAYLINRNCGRVNCRYNHHKFVQIDSVHRTEGFAWGRLSPKKLCRYYLYGTCRYGRNCRFGHDPLLLNEFNLAFENGQSSSDAPVHTNRFPTVINQWYVESGHDRRTNGLARVNQLNSTSENVRTVSVPKTNMSDNDESRHQRHANVISTEVSLKDKTCGICFEIVVEKDEDQRFGILPNCRHCFCISCICRWRKSRNFDNQVIKSCPECRVTSDFVYPSRVWVDNPQEKNRVIENYKNFMSSRDCKYFKKGKGKCPFGNKCFYKHANEDGRLIDVGPPSRRRTGNLRNSDVRLTQQEMQYLQRILFMNMFEDVEGEELLQWNHHAEELDYDMLSDFGSEWTDDNSTEGLEFFLD